MAIVVGLTEGQVTADVLSITPTLPAHVAGDLLLVFWSKDDGAGGTPTLSGGSWATGTGATAGGSLTGLVGTTGVNSARGGWLYLVASSGSTTPPTITSTDADSWCWAVVNVRGAPATNPIDTSGTNNDTVGSPYDATGVTTSTANCLIFYAAASDGGVSTTAYPGLMNLSCKDSGNDALAVAWTFQPTAGATGTKQFYAQGTSDEQVFHCIAVKDGSSGALIPVYADSTLCTLITPNKQTTCLTGENVTPTNNNTVPILPASSSRAAGSVFQCDTSGGPSYVDYTTAASNATDADVIPFPATEAAGASGTGDAFMIGDDAKFNAIRFDRLGCTNGVAGVVAWEYYNGTIWKALPAIRDLTTNFTATLGDFQMVGWTEPADWVTATFNSATRYWVRARCSTLWTTNPTISQVFVGTHGIEYDAIAQVADAGVNPFEGRLGTTPAATGGLFAGANFQWGASKSLGGTAYLISSYIYGVPRDKIDAGLAKNGGVVMALGDTSNRYRVWVVGAADGLGDRADKRNMVGVQPSYSTTALLTDTSYDPTILRNQLMIQKNENGACVVNWGHIVQAGKTRINGGSTGNPCTWSRIVEVATSFPVPLIDEGEVKQTIQFGGGGAIYVDAELFSASFPTSNADNSTLHLWHVDNSNVGLGIEVDARSGDTLYLRNAQFSGVSWWKFDVLATASAAATYDFTGLTLVGANVTLRDVTTFSGMSFINSRQITLETGVDLSDCSIVFRSAELWTMNGSGHTIVACAFDCSSVALDASGMALTGAQFSTFSDCSFVNGGGGHAVRITDSGTFTFDGNTFGSDFGTTEIQFHTLSDVNDVSDVVANSPHSYATGDPVIYRKRGGSVNIGLTTNTTYYVRAVSSAQIGFHPTAADAIANTNRIALTKIGNETHYLYSPRAAIQFDLPTASVTVNITGGGSTPSFSVPDSVPNTRTVTIVNAINLTISGFVTGSDVVVYEAGTSTVLDDAQDVVGTSWDFIYEGASVGTSVDVGVFKAGYRPYYIRGYTLGASDASLPVSQTVDRDYIV